LWQRKQGTINDVSINTNLRGIRALCYYAMDKGYLSSFRIKLLKVVKKIKPVYTSEELEKLLKKPDIKTCTFTEYRSWVMVNYLLATANRLETLYKVNIEDVDFKSREISLLHTKNKKQYKIPLSQNLSQILAEYLTYRKGDKGDALFCNAYGERMHKRTIQENIQKYHNSRGVVQTSSHRFRHTFAKLWLMNGGDIFSLQAILGHSSLEMVKEYMEMFCDDLQKGFNIHNPLDCFNREKKQQQGNRIRMRT